MTDSYDYIAMADMDEAMDKMYELKEVIPQESRFGATTQHITGDKPFRSQDMTIELLKTAFHGATMSKALEGDAPAPYEIELVQLTIGRTDLREFSFTLEHTLVAQTLGRDREHSAYEPAKRMIMQAEAAVGERRNQALNQGVDCTKAVIDTRYDQDGTAYDTPGSANTQLFWKIKSGSISSFHPGERLDVRAGATGTTVRTTVQVLDVIHTTDFRGNAGVGPGIVVEYDSTYTISSSSVNGITYDGDSDLDSCVADDELVRHAEIDAAGFPASFGTLIDLDSSPSTYFGINRGTVGNYYLVPYGKSYLSGTDNVNLNIETHFGEMVDVMAMVLGPSRIWRGERDFKLSNAIVAQAQPDLVNEIARQAGADNARFQTEMSSTMSAARKKEFVANAGWNGAVLHFPNFPPVIVQPEALAPPNKIRLFDPSAWTFYRLGGKQPTWIRNDTGGRWHAMKNLTSGRLTKRRQASAYVHETLVCDQPKSVYEIQGVKSTLKSE